MGARKLSASQIKRLQSIADYGMMLDATVIPAPGFWRGPTDKSLVKLGLAETFHWQLDRLVTLILIRITDAGRAALAARKTEGE